MKIRIQGNSIRYRLRQPEVEKFKSDGVVMETMRLSATDQLRFVLRRSMSEEIRVEYDDKTTTIYVPASLANRWTDSDLVGFDATIEISDGVTLKALIEKDFKCLDGSDEDNIGAYANPAKEC